LILTSNLPGFLLRSIGIAIVRSARQAMHANHQLLP